jgi:hypothetical protein
MALKCKDKRDICMLKSVHNEEMQTVCDKKGGKKQEPKVWTDYNDAISSADFSDLYVVTYSMKRNSMKCYQKIFCHLLRPHSFQFVTFRKHGVKYTHIQFCVHTAHKLFQKYE